MVEDPHLAPTPRSPITVAARLELLTSRHRSAFGAPLDCRTPTFMAAHPQQCLRPGDLCSATPADRPRSPQSATPRTQVSSTTRFSVVDFTPPVLRRRDVPRSSVVFSRVILPDVPTRFGTSQTTVSVWRL